MVCLFEPARKKSIPVLPRAIGVVTSPRGAALQDILNILRRRHESVNVLIYPAQVQGEAAASEVTAGVRYFSRAGGVDVIIVARGGGSFEDLFAFNDEGLARAVAACEIPLISAVGHETDFTICDFVADLRAPTPSAAAELVIRSKHELAEKLLGFHKRMTQAVNYKLLRATNALSNLAQKSVFARMQDSIARRQQRVDDLGYRMAQAQARILKSQSRRIETLETHLRRHDLRVRTGIMRRQLESHAAELNTVMARLLVTRRTEVNRLRVALSSAQETVLLRRRSRWERVNSSLQALSPKAILDRGYALVFDADGRLVKQASQLQTGAQVRTQLGRGEFTSQVNSVRSEDPSADKK
jgi:exodeoxyribonuclease VII large subunit